MTMTESDKDSGIGFEAVFVSRDNVPFAELMTGANSEEKDKLKKMGQFDLDLLNFDIPSMKHPEDGKILHARVFIYNFMDAFELKKGDVVQVEIAEMLVIRIKNVEYGFKRPFFQVLTW
jgi:hypothetical protein